MTGYYRDFRDYLRVLEESGLLIRVSRPIVKETELMPLVRLQFTGLPEEQRKGFLFENVVGVKEGTRYETKLATGVLGSSRRIYAMALQCATPSEITPKWERARQRPIEPKLVSSGQCQEVENSDQALDQDGKGLEAIPWPIALPGFGSDPRTTASHVVTRDPETGAANVGNYQAVFRGKRCMTLQIVKENHGYIHWKKYRALNKPMPVAIFIGATPAVAYASFSRIPYGINEYAVAGGLAGEPVELVRCRTVDLEVPANSEFVIEGHLRPNEMEPATPFGEFPGYMAMDEWNLIMDVSCVTHRRNPIFHAVVSEARPSEGIATKLNDENTWYNFLKNACNFPNLIDVTSYETGGAGQFLVLRMRKNHPSDPVRAMTAAQSYRPGRGKIIITVDEDINPNNFQAIIWALTTRMMPHRDVKILAGRGAHDYDYSGFPPGTSPEHRSYPEDGGGSSILIDATRKWPYPPVALPAKGYMENAIKIWNELGLAELKVNEPWYGYHLGLWSEEVERYAQLAVKGEFYMIGELLIKRRGPPEDLGLG